MTEITDVINYVLEHKEFIREYIDSYENINSCINLLPIDMIREFQDRIVWNEKALDEFDNKNSKIQDEFKKYLRPLREERYKREIEHLKFESEMIKELIDSVLQ